MRRISRLTSRRVEGPFGGIASAINAKDETDREIINVLGGRFAE